jgi:hypothetical protein
MTNVPFESDNLTLIDHYVVQTRQRLTEQGYHIRQLTEAGHDTVHAEETFQGMEKTLSSIRAFREKIVFDLLGQ